MLKSWMSVGSVISPSNKSHKWGMSGSSKLSFADSFKGQMQFEIKKVWAAQREKEREIARSKFFSMIEMATATEGMYWSKSCLLKNTVT